MQDFRQLQVRQRSHELTKAVCRSTRAFPTVERYGLTSEMRRSAVSIPENIAEGCCRSGDVEFARFLQIPMGSASELEYYFVLGRDLGLLVIEEYDRLVGTLGEAKRMLASLIHRLKADS